MKTEDEQLQSKVDLISDIENIVQQAKKMTKEQQDGTESKTQKLKGIRTNRQVEKMINRESEAFELDKMNGNENGVVVAFNKINEQKLEDERDEFEDEMALLRKKQRERTHGKIE